MSEEVRGLMSRVNSVSIGETVERAGSLLRRRQAQTSVGLMGIDGDGAGEKDDNFPKGADQSLLYLSSQSLPNIHYVSATLDTVVS